MKYWNYTVQHVVGCKHAVPHSTTSKIPHEVLLDRTSPQLVHLKPFGCVMHHQPPKPRLPTFNERVKDVLGLYHEGGVLYQVLTRTGVVKTKHVRPDGTKYPVMSLFSRKDNPQKNESDGQTASDEISVSSGS